VFAYQLIEASTTNRGLPVAKSTSITFSQEIKDKNRMINKIFDVFMI
jgi:hypothetical protein